MRDTKPLEKEALNLIHYKLQKFGYQYAELSFDEDGVDGIIYNDVHNLKKILRFQAKGRSIITNSSNVKIRKEYLLEQLICFVYIVTDNEEESHLYMFTSEDICQWNQDENNYKLYIGKEFTSDSSNDRFRFTKQRASLLSDLIQKQEYMSYKIDLDDLELIKLSYYLWINYDSLIDASLLAKIDEENNIFIYSTPIGIFLLCLYVIHEEAGGFFGIDWSMQYLKMIESNIFVNTDLLEVKDTYRSDYGFTYHNTYVEKVISKHDASVHGFHLHIGDKEESADAYLLSDGKYSITITSLK